MWAFILFLVIAMARPVSIPLCPTGQVYDAVKKACVDRLDDRDLPRGDAPRAPDISTPPGEGPPSNPPGPPGNPPGPPGNPPEPPGNPPGPPGDDKPGHGHGDPNHGHTGPPGRNK